MFIHMHPVRCIVFMIITHHQLQLQSLIQMSKRIFAPPTPTHDHKPTPNCYYHKLPITHFCTKKKCTLPLCADCLPIHKKEHVKDKQIAMEGIVEFQSARADCLGAFGQRKEEIQAIQQKFKAKVTEYRRGVLEVVQRVVDKFLQDCLLTDGNIEILKEIQERTSQIRAGSLKELIRYYEDIYGAQHFRKLYKMYTGDYLAHFAFQLNKSRLEEVVSAGMVNMALREANVDAKHRGDQSKHRSDQPSLDVSEYHEVPAPINIYIAHAEHMNAAKHISTEEESESQISSYKLVKSKRQNKAASFPTNPNIYTQPNSNIQQRLSQIRLSHIPSSNTSHVSRSRSKKKGISLVKSQQQLPIHSRENFTVEDEKPAHTERRASNWRNFVNMGEKKAQEPQLFKGQGGSNGKNELNTVLNPAQMRQLLAKKKSEEKYKAGKTVVVRKEGQQVQTTTAN